MRKANGWGLWGRIILLISLAGLVASCGDDSKPEKRLIDFPFGAGGFRLTNADKEAKYSITASLDGRDFDPNPIRVGSAGKATPATDKNVESTKLAMNVGDDVSRNFTFRAKDYDGHYLRGVEVTFDVKKGDPYHLSGRVFVYTKLDDPKAFAEKSVDVTIPKP
jgi:hypothetical protein